MKKIAFIALILLLVLPIVSADLIVPGFIGVEYCAKITNINDFPDYYFIHRNYGPMGMGFRILKENECISTGYKFSQNGLYAIKKSDFNEQNLTDWKIPTHENVEYEIYNEQYFSNLSEKIIPLDENVRIRTGTMLWDIKGKTTDSFEVYDENGLKVRLDRNYNYFTPQLLTYIISIISFLIIIYKIMKKRKEAKK
jgi:hypothetical protein